MKLDYRRILYIFVMYSHCGIERPLFFRHPELETNGYKHIRED